MPVLVRRILTTLLILPLFLAGLFWLPHKIWGMLMLLITLLASVEWARLIALDARQRLAFGASIALTCVALASMMSPLADTTLIAVGLGFWIVIVPIWLTGHLAAATARLAVAGWLVLVTAWAALYLMQVDPVRLLALIAVVWIADTSAYFAGRAFGRRKLAPAISPGKTWEGVFGAVVVVGVYYGLLWWAIAPAALAGQRLLDAITVGVILVLSVEGDLFESWLKRRAGVKDSGTLLPGHGGILDRIDGLVAALPAAALPMTLSRV